MKHTKTYDSFITNIFTKRKKLPIEILNLNSSLFNIVEYYIKNGVDKKWSVNFYEQEASDKKNHNILSIIVDPEDMGSDAKIVGLYYKEESKLIMLVFIEVSKSVKNLEDFFNHILNSFEATKFNNHMNSDYYFYIPLDKVQSVIDEMTIENLKDFLELKKYNL